MRRLIAVLSATLAASACGDDGSAEAGTETGGGTEGTGGEGSGSGGHGTDSTGTGWTQGTGSSGSSETDGLGPDLGGGGTDTDGGDPIETCTPPGDGQAGFPKLTFGGPIALGDAADGYGPVPTYALALGDGDLVGAWIEEDRINRTVYLQGVEVDGSAAGPRATVVQDSAAEAVLWVDIAYDSGHDDFGVVWTSVGTREGEFSLHFARYDRFGALVTDPIELGDVADTGHPPRADAVTMVRPTSDGLAVFFNRTVGDNVGVHFLRITSDGTGDAVSEPQVISVGQELDVYTGVERAGDQFVIKWQGGRHLWIDQTGHVVQPLQTVAVPPDAVDTSLHVIDGALWAMWLEGTPGAGVVSPLRIGSVSGSNLYSVSTLHGSATNTIGAELRAVANPGSGSLDVVFPAGSPNELTLVKASFTPAGWSIDSTVTGTGEPKLYGYRDGGSSVKSVSTGSNVIVPSGTDWLRVSRFSGYARWDTVVTPEPPASDVRRPQGLWYDEKDDTIAYLQASPFAGADVYLGRIGRDAAMVTVEPLGPRPMGAHLWAHSEGVPTLLGQLAVDQSECPDPPPGWRGVYDVQAHTWDAAASDWSTESFGLLTLAECEGPIVREFVGTTEDGAVLVWFHRKDGSYGLVLLSRRPGEPELEQMLYDGPESPVHYALRRGAAVDYGLYEVRVGTAHQVYARRADRMTGLLEPGTLPLEPDAQPGDHTTAQASYADRDRLVVVYLTNLDGELRPKLAFLDGTADDFERYDLDLGSDPIRSFVITGLPDYHVLAAMDGYHRADAWVFDDRGALVDQTILPFARPIQTTGGQALHTGIDIRWLLYPEYGRVMYALGTCSG